MNARGDPVSFQAQAVSGRLHVCKLASLAVLLGAADLHAENAFPFTAAQRVRLASLVESDAQAGSLFAKFQQLADKSLKDSARPATRISTAGKLAADAAKVESRAALEDMRKLEALGFAYAVTTNADYANTARRMILAWVRTYQPSGSPVDETKLEPLFVAFGLTKEKFSGEDRKSVESWLRQIVQRQRQEVRVGNATEFNNWNSHRLKIIGLIAGVLNDADLFNSAVSGFKTQVARNLYADGSSFDFRERDALHYHCYDLEPLLTLAMVAQQRGVKLYDYESSEGGSLRKSVWFLAPYCDGRATHAEWVNSKVAFDRARAQAGEGKFEVGAPFEPRDALRVLTLASFFDHGLDPLVAKLTKSEGKGRFSTWQSVLNEAMKP